MRSSSLLAASLLLAHAAALTLPCDIHGFSISSIGFVALLADRPRARWLPLRVAEDSESAATPEALTLLQLLQGIDLGGAILPPELLQDRTGESMLDRVCVISPDSFELCTAEARAPCDNAFEALALSMRYSARIEVDAGVLDSLAMPEAEGAARYPRCYTAENAAEQRAAISRRMAGELEAPPPAADAGAPLDVQGFDPSTLTAPPPPPESKLNANKPPPGMLAKALEIAKQKGDTAAAAKIEKMLSESDRT